MLAAPVIEVAVATMNARDPLALRARLQLDDASVRLLIINQCPDGDLPADYPSATDKRSAAAHERSRQPPATRMFSFRERGLSRSRNRALSLASGDILVIADDDVKFLPDMAAAVTRAFASHPGAAVFSFQLLRNDETQPGTRYPARAHRHTPLSVARVSSCEIALRPSALRGLRFDERFGLGAPLPQGEEPIFLAEALRRGLELRYWPEPLCRHWEPSSGELPWPAEVARAKGAVLRHMYPRLWPAMVAAMWATKYRRHGRVLGLRDYTRELLRGTRLP